ncbi:putative hydroxyisocaproate protein [Botrytis fragariae]|uniref:Putative hydroxyisocaproate protein n=1 Tax=Botrytis fragariae TaxID=1964551 RepID=A0A8H6ENX1_9HELO|nr:putative hydroxyisocaproate protein [Botrytis fragariae]KAF5879137.1 putative hydroxyisocaproate protein [Botrytis fragariae]
MDLPKVLLIGTIYCASSEWNNLSDIAELIHLNDGNRDTFRNSCHSGHYDGVVVTIRCEDAYKYTGRFDTDLIQSLPKSVKFICAPQCLFRMIGIAVSNSPANIGNATADAAMYLLLGALRRSWISSLSIRNGQWRGYAGLGHDPEGKVLGILGMGNIGSVVAKRAAAFDMHIQYYSRNPLPRKGHLQLSDMFPLKTFSGQAILFQYTLHSRMILARYTLGSNEFA